ncbi:MAG: hypothetical protein LBU65_03655 [Planctomycetaceae bacterium]|nr:hypothetical protein [Planctomycetaceae bacterium]
MIGNKDEVNGKPMGFLEKRFRQLLGEGCVDVLLQFLVRRQEFDEIIGDGFIGGTASNGAADGEEGFATTKSGDEDFDDDVVVDFIAVKFGGKKLLNANGKVALDFVCRLPIIISCRTHSSSS